MIARNNSPIHHLVLSRTVFVNPLNEGFFVYLCEIRARICNVAFLPPSRIFLVLSRHTLLIGLDGTAVIVVHPSILLAYNLARML